MPPFRSLKKGLALIDIELANLEIPRFYGQKDELHVGFQWWNKSWLVKTLMTKGSSRWLF